MKRLPKGMGSVYKLSGNRRRPYTARIQAGRDENGKPILQIPGILRNGPGGLTGVDGL